MKKYIAITKCDNQGLENVTALWITKCEKSGLQDAIGCGLQV